MQCDERMRALLTLFPVFDQVARWREKEVCVFSEYTVCATELCSLKQFDQQHLHEN